MQLVYLWCIMDPLSIHKELVLVLSLWQVQDRYEVIVALRKGEENLWNTVLSCQLKIPCCLTQKLAWAPILQRVYLLFRGIFVLQLLKEPEM